MLISVTEVTRALETGVATKAKIAKSNNAGELIQDPMLKLVCVMV